MSRTVKNTLKVIGVLIMFLAFLLIPEEYPWYFRVLLFNVGLALYLLTKWKKFKSEWGIIKNESNKK